MTSESAQRSELRELTNRLDGDSRFEESLARDPVAVLFDAGLPGLAGAVVEERERTRSLAGRFETDPVLRSRLEREPFRVLEEEGFPPLAAEPVLAAVGASTALLDDDVLAHIQVPGRKTAALWTVVVSCLGAAAYAAPAVGQNPVEPDPSLSTHVQKSVTRHTTRVRTRAVKPIPQPVHQHLHLVVNDPDQ